MSTCRNRGRRCAGWAVASFALVACLVPAGAGAALPDHRGWELVSPTEKNGGSIRAAGEVSGGGVFQAAADGESVTYSSTASFASPAQSAPPGSQYISSRVTEGWSTKNVNVPILSGSYGADPDGVPYQLFSADLGRGLLLNGGHAAPRKRLCPVVNPPLAGTDAPAGYQNYYLRAGQWLRGPDRRIRRFQLQPRPGSLHCPSGRLVARPRSRDPRNLRRADHRRDRSPAGRRLRPGEAESLRVVGGLRPEPGQLRAGCRARRPGGRGLGRRLPGLLHELERRQSLPARRAVSSSRSTATPPEEEPSRPPAATAGPRTSSRPVTSGTTRPAPTRPPTSPRPAGSSECSMPPPTASTSTTSPPTASTSGTGAATTKAAAGADSSNYPPTTGTTRVSADGTRLVFVSLGLPHRLRQHRPENRPARFRGLPLRRRHRRARLRVVPAERHPSDRPLDDSRGPGQRPAARGHRDLQAAGALGRRQPGLLRLRRLARPGRRQPRDRRLRVGGRRRILCESRRAASA